MADARRDIMSDAPVHRQELTPIHFLERAGEAYADRAAVIDGDLRLTWRQLRGRARRFASALRGGGPREGGRVAFPALNSGPPPSPHLRVPLAGGVLPP